MKIAVIIPFRDCGTDPLRAANLLRVRNHWSDFGAPIYEVDDGREADASFNRCAAYNRGAARAKDADVLVYAEADMLISGWQVREAVARAAGGLGMVVPFRQYRALTARESERVRTYNRDPAVCDTDYVMDDGHAVGAINVMHRDTLEAIGCWDETFEGNGYDDKAMERALAVAAGPIRWVEGPAYHLYHLPGWRGDHLSEADRAATEANRIRWHRYLKATTPREIRTLTAGG